MALSDDVDLLTEYTQWQATRKAVLADTTPETFMKDRLKEVAYDRIEEALDYINKCGVLRMEPDKQKIVDILQGTVRNYAEYDAEGAESEGTVGYELGEDEEHTIKLELHREVWPDEK